MANGGWKDSLTVNNPALTGQAGYLVVQVRARGSLRATSWSGAASLNLHVYKNQVFLASNPHFANASGVWSVSSSSPDADNLLPVDGVMTYGVPITFGQPFTLGVYAVGTAGMRSSGGFAGISTSRCDFSGDGITWQGVVGIRNAAGEPVAGSTVSSASGVDWTVPYTPPPVCGTSDFNGDGDFGTDADIEAFFACLAGSCCGTCFEGGSDFNGDGDFGTDADIEAFFRVLGGGNC